MPRKKTQQETKEANNKRDAKPYRQDVDVWDQDHIIHAWAEDLALRGYRLGRWRQVTLAGRVHTLPAIPNVKRSSGLSGA